MSPRSDVARDLVEVELHHVGVGMNSVYGLSGLNLMPIEEVFVMLVLSRISPLPALLQRGKALVHAVDGVQHLAHEVGPTHEVTCGISGRRRTSSKGSSTR